MQNMPLSNDHFCYMNILEKTAIQPGGLFLMTLLINHHIPYDSFDKTSLRQYRNKIP